MENDIREKTEFSVAMCVYGKDNPKWFRRALESVYSQTIIPNEVVLVVDGPIGDDLQSVNEEYSSVDGFKAIYLETNQGHGNARRKSLECCSYELVALMDADDVCLPDRFEKQLQAFSDNNEVSVVGGNISEFIEQEENIVGYRIVPEKHDDIVKYMKKRCPMNQVSVMFKNTDVKETGGYVDWFCEEDYYLWLRMFLAGKKFYNLQDTLVNVRVGKDMYARRGGWKYYKSEKALQKYMLKNKIIGYGTYLGNVLKRFIVQVLMPNKLRGWVFKKFARQRKGK
jgi:glycosyltransferase involved in cell wall biosynthesis